MIEIDTLYLIDDDTTSNFLNENIIKKCRLAKNVKTYNYANIAFDDLKHSLLADNPKVFPDLILLDIKMPYMDGWQFLDEFEKLPEAALEKCKLFMFSSSVDSKDIEKSKTYKSVNGFISKPLSLDKLNIIK
jgi:CheY-like chemotaxis protein